MIALRILLSTFCLTATTVQAEPPYQGTNFVANGIITADDPSAFVSLTHTGQDARYMFDRRPNDWIQLKPFLFMATFSDGLRIEVQVNPEFETVAAAEAEAMRYMHAVGQLPTLLRKSVRTMWIHKGKELFGGGNENLLVHQDQGTDYIRSKVLEETLFHEAVHTSIDPTYADDPKWLAAQIADGEFISTYARDYPTREDLAESMLLAFAVTHRSDRLPPEVRDTIVQTMPNRIAFFAELLPPDAPLFETP